MTSTSPKTTALGVIFAITTFCGSASAQGFGVEFEDQTTHAFGSIPRGPSFGAGAWGDFNQDGFPDLWLGNHAGTASLWRNNGDGSFSDVASVYFPSASDVDSHGAAWADFDDDGDLDLLECVGADQGAGLGPNLLWENRHPLPFQEIARTVGLAYPTGRARMPLWLDWNEDGLLDVIVSAFPGQFSTDVLFTQQADKTFIPELGTVGFQPTQDNTRLAQLADFDSDGKVEVLLQARVFPNSLMDFDAGGFQTFDLPSPLEPIANVQDVAVGDFDGDQDQDLYLTRDPFWNLNEVEIDANGALRAAIRVTEGRTRFTFRCSGDFVAELPIGLTTEQVYLGANRVSPNMLPLVVFADDKRLLGTRPGAAGMDFALYIGRETDSDTYEVVVTSPVDISGSMVVRSRAPIQVVDGGVDRPRWTPDGVLWADPAKPRVTAPDFQFAGRSVVAADFDNDTDLDIYVMRTGAAVNLPNRLYENLGGGEFRVVANAAGAKGPALGVADSVSVADYDQDGFLDLLLTNGWGIRPLTSDAPVTLLRNRGGNGNHWLAVELHGSRSNPHGLGAIVRIKSNGISQRRDQGGGMHRSTQNHSTLHFGLGKATKVQSLEVTWPDGSVQTLRNIDVDQLIRIEQL